MDVVTQQSSSIPLVAIFGILASAAAVASLIWAISRKSLDRTRERWRLEDRLEGFIDDKGRWHRGLVDDFYGWTDDEGVEHRGDHEILASHGRRLDRIERRR